MYKRKTVDVWEVQGDYGSGFETVTIEETKADAWRMKKDYELNEPQYRFRIKKTREKIAKGTV